MVPGGVFAALTLGVICVVLCVVLAQQRKRQRHAEAANRQLLAALDAITDLIRQVQRNPNFSLRCENPNLVPCWTVLECDNPTCVAYENPDLRCWHLPGVLCPGSDEESFLQKMVKCKTCKVYHHAQPDNVAALSEHVNNLLAMLQEEREKLIQTQRRAQQASKLASIGEFAAGIAHEINNPLDGVLSCMARLERDPANLTQNMEYLKLMHDALARMSMTVQHLLEYSQEHDPNFEATDIHKVIENVAAQIKTSARRNAVDIEFEFGDTVPLLLGDVYQLEQAFLNLALNALAATPEGGALAFRTRIDGSADGVGRLVQVDVADTGDGIDPANLGKIFDPFFTTKEPGKGTGLGLSIVKSIVEDHQGRVTVESAVGAGTTVSVFLPIGLETGPRTQAHGEAT